MPFSSTRPLLLATAVCLGAVVATIALTDAQARGGGGGGGHPAMTTTSRAPVFRPQQNAVTRPPRFNSQTQFRPNNQGINRRTQGLTQSNGGRHNVRCHSNCGGHPNPNANQNNPAVQQVHPQPVVTQKPLNVLTLKQGPGKPVTFKPAATSKPTFPVVNVHNKFWPVLKGQKFIWVAGHRRFFIPVGLLGIALIGDSYWYPDGYVSIAGPLCAGFTPDGCLLEWRLVDFEDGGSEALCVQYCPQVGPPPAKVVKLPPPPVLAVNGNCQLTIYENPSFSGLSAPTSDNQPLLSETGWKDEISSIQVQSGTWDFFSEENFGGDSTRMAAGSYPQLVPEWNKRIGSFMCVEPGGSGA